MIKFIFPEYKYLGSAFNNLADGRFSINRFPNQEMYVTLKTNVKNEDCLVAGSITPPDENLIAMLFLSHTLKKEGADKITLFLPYLAYARHDKQKPGESLVTEEIGRLLKVSNVSSIVTIEAHSQKLEDFYHIPVTSLSTTKLFASVIKKLNLNNPVFVAPDEGSLKKAQDLFDESGKKGSVTYFKKKRSTGGKITSVLQAQVSGVAIIIDDMLDTGGTLVTACEHLQTKGVKDIYILVTHGLFTGEKWHKLWDLGVKKIYCTDSIPNPDFAKNPNIEVLSIKPIIEEYLR
ncbi:MAG: ribose-phosphate diphosphokinase [Microgenomates group bacterium]|jgi:ribose-phosphate pyrophosphokinase